MGGQTCGIQDRLEKLKEHLVNDDTFSVTANYFFDNLAGDRSFFQQGKVVKNPMLKKIMRKACEDFISKEQQMTNLLIVQLKGHPFLHGAFHIGPNPSSFFYFEELKKGMIIIVRSMTTGNNSYIRFTGTVLPGKGMTLAPGSNVVQ